MRRTTSSPKNNASLFGPIMSDNPRNQKNVPAMKTSSSKSFFNTTIQFQPVSMIIFLKKNKDLLPVKQFFLITWF